MLPTDAKTPWPPPAVRSTLARIRDLDAWYSDNVDALYGAGTADAAAPGRWKDLFRSGRLNRTDGAPYSAGSSLATVHVPMAADIARTSADLLFSEAPKFTAELEGGQGRLNELVELLELDSILPEQGELCAALEGVYWRATFDLAAVSDHPILSWVSPDYAVPEWRWGRLVAVTFWEVLPPPTGDRTDVVWRALERHSTEGPAGAAIVEHGLYQGTPSELGRPMALADHPATRALAGSLTGDQVLRLPADVPLTAGYIPNMRPNRQARGTALGRADIQGWDSTLRGIDKTWSSWMRDLDLGKGRVIVPNGFLREIAGPGSGATFDLDRAIYSGLEIPISMDGSSQLQIVQFNIRVTEHQTTLNEQMRAVIRGCGYSARSFGIDDGAGAVTATEVKASERLSMITREKKSRYWDSGLGSGLECITAMDRVMFGGAETGRIKIEFGDSVAEDPHRTAETVELMFRAQSASLATRVEMLHPDWSEGQVLEEVARIIKETAVPDPMGIPEAGQELEQDGPTGADRS